MAAVSVLPSPSASPVLPLAALAGAVASPPEPPRLGPTLAGRLLAFVAAVLLALLLAGLVLTAASLRPSARPSRTPLGIWLDRDRLPDAERTRAATGQWVVWTAPAGPASP